MQASKKTHKAIFFDRDGVITPPDYDAVDKKDYAVRDPKKLKLYRNCETVIKKVKLSGYLTFVFSNQPDIALKKIDEKTKQDLEEKFKQILKTKGIAFNEIAYCHHHENSINSNYAKDCDCRKPKPGMLFTLAQKWNVDLASSYVIGDTYKDIEAGKKAGCTTILIDRLWSKKIKCNPDFVINNLEQALDIIGK